jgi:sugar-phosphatase
VNSELAVGHSVAILSDLDGTLIDSRASLVRAFEWWAQARGLPPIGDRLPFGRSSADAVRILAPHLDAESEGAVLDRRQAQDTEGVVALPGARELLDHYLPLAVVTSCTRPLALARLVAADLPVPDVLATPERWTRGKPDPEPYLVAAGLLGVPPSRCVVLEDTLAGVQAGAAAGMTVIAVLTTLTLGDLPGAAAGIESPAQLPAALRALGL